MLVAWISLAWQFAVALYTVHCITCSAIWVKLSNQNTSHSEHLHFLHRTWLIHWEGRGLLTERGVAYSLGGAWLHTFNSSAPLNGMIIACGSLASIHSLILDNLKDKGEERMVVEREGGVKKIRTIMWPRNKVKATDYCKCACVLRMLKTSGRFEECMYVVRSVCVR